MTRTLRDAGAGGSNPLTPTLNIGAFPPVSRDVATD